MGTVCHGWGQPSASSQGPDPHSARLGNQQPELEGAGQGAVQGDRLEGTITLTFHLTQDGVAQLQQPQRLDLGFGTTLEVSRWRATHLHPCYNSFTYANSPSTPKFLQRQ